MSAFLIFMALVSSALTATIGMGGGILLLSVMPGLVPAAALIPLHGATQLASNVARTGTNWRHVTWPLVVPYAVGAVLGATAGAPLARRMPVEWIPPLLGVFVLAVLWWPRRSPPTDGRVAVAPVSIGAWGLLGAIQTALSLFVGAAGPLSGPWLLRRGLGRDALVATHAAFMSVMHGLKVVVFGVLGFAFGPYLALLAGMIAAVFVGTWIGNRLRSRVPEERFRGLFRWTVTLLALRLIFRFGV